MFSIVTAGLCLVVLWGTLSTSSAAAASAKSLTCNDPKREELEELWRIHGDWHESIFNLKDMQNVGLTLRNVSDEYVNIKTQDLQPGVCPYGEGSDDELERYRKSVGGKFTLCPSHDVINYDENRVPSTLFHKACSCTSCAFQKSLSGGERGYRSKRSINSRGRRSAHSTLGCSPVYYHVKVLRRVNCVNNEFIYRPVLEPLVVACSCDHSARQTRGTKKLFIVRTPVQ